MKFYLITLAIIVLLSSCLKQSIPDAMLASQNGGHGNVTATLSYKVNGNAVNISVNNADNQNSPYTLGCTKLVNQYILEGLSNSGEITFIFYNNLGIGNYKYTGIYGDMFFISYNGTNEFVHAASDSMSFNISSYTNGHISGNFSGLLTPLLDPNNNTYGPSGSVHITNGVFQNVPVFY